MGCDVFVSYTRLKDEWSAVTDFRKHFENQLRQKTGNVNLKVFQDKNDIHGGDKFADRLLDELASAKLLLILFSPTWLKSEWCRKEYQLFVAGGVQAKDRPVVPLVWDSVPDSIATTQEEKDVLEELKAYQMLSWTDLRYEDWSTPAPNRALDRIAKELSRRL